MDCIINIWSNANDVLILYSTYLFKYMTMMYVIPIIINGLHELQHNILIPTAQKGKQLSARLSPTSF